MESTGKIELEKTICYPMLGNSQKKSTIPAIKLYYKPQLKYNVTLFATIYLN